MQEYAYIENCGPIQYIHHSMQTSVYSLHDELQKPQVN